jgi:hypothetical protein
MRTPVGIPLHAALQQVAHPQLFGYLLGRHGLALEGEAGSAGGDIDIRGLGKPRDELLGHAVAEIFLLGVARHVLEGQHRNRCFVCRRKHHLSQIDFFRRRWGLMEGSLPHGGGPDDDHQYGETNKGNFKRFGRPALLGVRQPRLGGNSRVQ